MTIFQKYGLFICLLVGISLHATNPREAYLEEDLKEHAFDEKDWQSLTKDLDYPMTPTEKKEIKPRERDLQSQSAWAQLLKIMAVILAIGALVILMVHLMGAENIFGRRNPKLEATPTAINIEDIEENIHEAKMDSFIRQALDEGNYAMAVRLYYLAILKELSLNRQIKWKIDKTNGEYLRELRGSEFFEPFRELTRIFERTWYGNFQIAKPDFEIIQPKFQKLIARIPETSR